MTVQNTKWHRRVWLNMARKSGSSKKAGGGSTSAATAVSGAAETDRSDAAAAAAAAAPPPVAAAPVAAAAGEAAANTHTLMDELKGMSTEHQFVERFVQTKFFSMQSALQKSFNSQIIWPSVS
jgi:hypothetical protein